MNTRRKKNMKKKYCTPVQHKCSLHFLVVMMLIIILSTIGQASDIPVMELSHMYQSRFEQSQLETSTTLIVGNMKVMNGIEVLSVTEAPTANPTATPTAIPTETPSAFPTNPTESPTVLPTVLPTKSPTTQYYLPQSFLRVSASAMIFQPSGVLKSWKASTPQ